MYIGQDIIFCPPKDKQDILFCPQKTEDFHKHSSTSNATNTHTDKYCKLIIWYICSLSCVTHTHTHTLIHTQATLMSFMSGSTVHYDNTNRTNCTVYGNFTFRNCIFVIACDYESLDDGSLFIHDTILNFEHVIMNGLSSMMGVHMSTIQLRSYASKF